jgi:hypothetical protein
MNGLKIVKESLGILLPNGTRSDLEIEIKVNNLKFMEGKSFINLVQVLIVIPILSKIYFS